MPFDPGRPRNSRKEATHCVFKFEHAPWESGQGLILYDASDMADGAYNLLELLMQFAPTVDGERTESCSAETSREIGPWIARPLAVFPSDCEGILTVR
jgi:hypothetical protein